MAETTIITGQFVRISQTPASIGERLIALVIDFILIGFYVYATATLLSTLRISSDFYNDSYYDCSLSAGIRLFVSM